MDVISNIKEGGIVCSREDMAERAVRRWSVAQLNYAAGKLDSLGADYSGASEGITINGRGYTTEYTSFAAFVAYIKTTGLGVE